MNCQCCQSPEADSVGFRFTCGSFINRNDFNLEESVQCLRNQLAQANEKIAAVTAERDALKAADSPEWDCTDAAHPAWWRGEEHGAKSICREINAILDGTNDCSGTCHEPWESTRKRVLSIKNERDAMRRAACKILHRTDYIAWRRSVEEQIAAKPQVER